MHTFLSHIQFSVLWHGLEQPYNIAVALSAKDMITQLGHGFVLVFDQSFVSHEIKVVKSLFLRSVSMLILQTPQAFARQAFATSFDIEILAVFYITSTVVL